MLGRWQAKCLTDSDANEIRGIVNTLEELAELPLETIKRFYGKGTYGIETEVSG